ncbi:MAG: glycosyltransferase family 2 protein [Acidobacteriota bacterium]|nr:glycosyltransferase family 2 protein [Acidobacteriota bacterium]
MDENVAQLSILIVSYNTVDKLEACLSSVERWSIAIPYEVLVLDNNSSDGSSEMVRRKFPNCKVIDFPTNEGYGVAINLGVSQANGNWLMFLNPDIEVTENAVNTLTAFAKSHPRAGVIGPRLLNTDGTPQASARRFYSVTLSIVEASRLHLLLPKKLRGKLLFSNYFDQDETKKVPWLSGACHLIPRKVWDQVGPLTEETFCGSDDYDYCYRAWQKGYEVWLCADASMTHHSGIAVKRRWSTLELDRVASHNFYLVLQSHWPKWRIKALYAAEIVSYLIEALRHFIKPRRDQNRADCTYGELLKLRLKLKLNWLLGREKPMPRFQPPGRSYVQSETPDEQIEYKPVL